MNSLFVGVRESSTCTRAATRDTQEQDCARGRAVEAEGELVDGQGRQQLRSARANTLGVHVDHNHGGSQAEAVPAFGVDGVHQAHEQFLGHAVGVQRTAVLDAHTYHPCESICELPHGMDRVAPGFGNNESAWRRHRSDEFVEVDRADTIAGVEVNEDGRPYPIPYPEGLAKDGMQQVLSGAVNGPVIGRRSVVEVFDSGVDLPTRIHSARAYAN